MPVTQETLDVIALNQEEYDLIVQRLGREPNEVELGMFGALWSEHCGYKHSKLLLKLFPTKGSRVLTGAGEENAGAVDIGNGLCVIMKMESHNHPSAIEPFQGAATGVGGIVRDIFTMGAYPVALLNSLRFGPLSDPRNRYLFEGVVGGIAAYGNCLGIPDVGGEIYFSPSYSGNPLVNAMCVGIAKKDRLVSAQASGEGNILMIVGADTGRDGIHGASGLASRTFEDERELRPTVQVGNPFLEKLLIEACFELAQTDLIVGMQDLGAAGLTSSAVECASRGGGGIDIDICKIPRREVGMTPYEVMLSESQERMLVVIKKGCEDKVREIFAHWNLPCDIIGHVISDNVARIRNDGRVVAELPVEILCDPPAYSNEATRPLWLDDVQRLDLDLVPDLAPEDCNNALLKLLASPNIASKEYVFLQYDHHVQTNTVISPGGDAALLRIKGTNTGIALTSDGNGRYSYLDPRTGGAICVAEAARNLACVGAKPVAVTDCLNFGDPEKPDVYYQLEESIKGMVDACNIFEIPVISGNVSLYNETRGQAIYPTPVIGMLGLVEDMAYYCTTAFKRDGDIVILLGEHSKDDDLGGSEYLETMLNMVAGKPSMSLDVEKRIQDCCISLINQEIINSAHDCSDGGLAVALAECCIAGNIGFAADDWHSNGRKDASLFGEAQSRIVVSVASKKMGALKKIAASYGIAIARLGEIGGNSLVVGELINLPVKQVANVYQQGLEKVLNDKVSATT